MNDDYHRHEVLHMSYFLMNSFCSEVVESEFVNSDTALKERAEKIMNEMFELYQEIGFKHVNDSKS